MLLLVVAAAAIGLALLAWVWIDYFASTRRQHWRPGLRKGQIRTVAVVGAGSSGIAAAKELLEVGIEPVVFEQSADIGGNWVYREVEQHSSVYRSTSINTCATRGGDPGACRHRPDWGGSQIPSDDAILGTLSNLAQILADPGSQIPKQPCVR